MEFRASISTHGRAIGNGQDSLRPRHLTRPPTAAPRTGASTALPDGLPTLSIGLAEMTADTADPHSLLTAADRALYSAKLHGRDRIAAAPAPTQATELHP